MEEDKCPTPLKIVMVGTNKIKKTCIIFNPDCKKWSCPHCSQKNLAEWLHNGIRGAMLLQQNGNELRFVTVTSRAHASPVQSLYYFKENWPRLNARMKYHAAKQNGPKLEYYLIPERHKTGVLHFHMLATTQLKERWFKDNAYKCGFGYEAKSKPVSDVLLASSYITKYLTKSIAFTRWPKGFRRVRTSRGWPMTKPKKDTAWEWQAHTEKSAWFERYLLNDAGYHIIDNRQAVQDLHN